MSKKANLAKALADIGGSVRKRPDPVPAASSAAEKTQTLKVEKSTSNKASTQPSRIATRPITVHFPQAVRDQLKILAIEEGKTLQSLIAEGFNDLFAKYGKPEIAPKD